MDAILSVRNLVVALRGGSGYVRAVDGVSFDIRPGETLGVVGESGSGKSVTALAILSLIAQKSIVAVQGEAMFGGANLLKLDRSRLRAMRGSDIAMIFQEPMTSLNPILKVGWQIAEVLVRHQNVSRRDAMKTAVSLMERVGIPAASRRANDYPHSLSGGMRQRIMIAIAIACRPKLLIADEPTTALDVTVQAQILALLDELKRELGMSVMLITHDLGVVAQATDRTIVMYGGRVVEQADTPALLAAPQHPYSRGLINAMPRLGSKKAGRNVKLNDIPGVVPKLVGDHSYCSFAPRCVNRFARCFQTQPAEISTSPFRQVRCFLYDSAEVGAA